MIALEMSILKSPSSKRKAGILGEATGSDSSMTRKLSLEEYVERLRINGSTSSSVTKTEEKLYEMFQKDNTVN